MRFCPFCTAENADDTAACQACGRRLPPLPPRRARNAPPTGVQLPQRKATQSQPPPIASAAKAAEAAQTAAVPPTVVSGPPGAMYTGGQSGPTVVAPTMPSSAPPTVIPTVRRATSPPLTSPAIPIILQPDRDSAPVLPPPPVTPPPLVTNEERQSILDAIGPSPAAVRRPPPPLEVRAPDQAPRRRTDQKPTTAPPPIAAARRPPADDDFNTVVEAPPIELDSGPPSSPPPSPPARPRLPSRPPPVAALVPIGEPPPTRILRPEALADRPFTPPKVHAIPEIPEPGLVNAARYALHFGRARYQRRGAIKVLAVEIKQDTEALDQVLGGLGKVARTVRVDGRVFSAENSAIADAEERVAQLNREHNDVDARKAEENTKFIDIERERNAKLAEAERMVEEGQRELAYLEGRRRALRDQRKELERRQKAYLKAAEDSDRQSGAAGMGDTRIELRRTAEHHRKEAAALEPERQDIDRQLGALDKPISEGTAKLDAAKAELDAAKRSLSDAREGHNHRLAELDAEQKRKAREIAQAESEIQRRLVTLGTLVNLNRIDDPRFEELYQRVDRLRGAITARTTEVEKLTAEREAFDRGTLVRGISVIGGAIVAFIAFIVILRAIF